MLREAVNAVVPSGQPSIWSTLTMFLDRGYFEISKPQTGENITNLIQLLNRLGVRFLGTVKDTNALPFLVQDKNTTDDKKRKTIPTENNEKYVAGITERAVKQKKG